MEYLNSERVNRSPPLNVWTLSGLRPLVGTSGLILNLIVLDTEVSEAAQRDNPGRTPVCIPPGLGTKSDIQL